MDFQVVGFTQQRKGEKKNFFKKCYDFATHTHTHIFFNLKTKLIICYVKIWTYRFFYFRVSQSAFKIVFFAASIRLPFICVNIDTLDKV